MQDLMEVVTNLNM